MPKIPVNFYYGSSEYLNTIPISEGNILYNVTNHQILVDEDSSRLCYSNKTTVDTKLNDKSNNPISNKVVSAEINALKNTTKSLQSDLTKKGSASSNEVDDVRGQIHTNLLNPTLETTTINGVTCTNNGDGTYTLNGTASAYTNFMVLPYTKGEKVKKGQYKLVGCPKGGGANKYNIWMCESSHGSDIDNLVEEYGDGVICNFEGAKSIHVEIQVISGTALPSGGITFKPMLTTDLDATYNDYVPYSGDGRLNENVAKLNKNVEGLIKSVSSTNNVFIWKTCKGKTDEEGNFEVPNVSGYTPIFNLTESPSRNWFEPVEPFQYHNVQKKFWISSFAPNKEITKRILYIKNA